MKNLGSVFAAYVIGWGVFFIYYITWRGELRRWANNRTAEEFAEPGQVDWQGRSESELCCFSSAGRIRWRPSSHSC